MFNRSVLGDGNGDGAHAAIAGETAVLVGRHERRLDGDDDGGGLDAVEEEAMLGAADDAVDAATVLAAASAGAVGQRVLSPAARAAARSMLAPPPPLEGAAAAASAAFAGATSVAMACDSGSRIRIDVFPSYDRTIGFSICTIED